jgi:hypothetical protein
MEKVPFAFSRALCSLTLPVLRTEIMIMRAFLLDAGAAGGGGDCGNEPSSWTRMCVMYDSWTVLVSARIRGTYRLSGACRTTDVGLARRAWRSSSL